MTDELKRLALAAKGWNMDTVIPATDEKCCEVGTMLDDEFYPLVTLECEDYYRDSKPLADFIVAASPDVVLAMIAENARLREALSNLVHAVEKARIWNGMSWTYHPVHPVHYQKRMEEGRQALEAQP